MNIISLRADNVKRLHAVEIKPDGNWVAISGKNGAGKTSVLDSIWWALGGAKNIQAAPIRKGEASARIKLALGTGGITELLVERRFTEKGDKNGYLFVRNADGSKRDAPDTVLRALTGALTFDPVGFMGEEPKKQLEIMRKLVPLLDDKGAVLDVVALDREAARLYEERTSINRSHASAKARHEAILVPEQPALLALDRDTLMMRLAEADAHNGAIDTMRREESDALSAIDTSLLFVNRQKDTIADAEAHLMQLRLGLASAEESLDVARARHADLSTRAHPDRIDVGAVSRDLVVVNEQMTVQARYDDITQRKAESEGEAEAFAEEGASRTTRIDAIAAIKSAALARAKMPVPGLGFGEEGVTFNDLPLEQASDAEQLRVSCAICAAMNPTLRIMRIRNGNALDAAGRSALAAFAQANDFQIWIELVDDTGELGVVIEDGRVKGQDIEPETAEQAQASGTITQQIAAPPSDERTAQAETYLGTVIDELNGLRDPIAVDRLHAKVKVKLAAFPSLIAQEWTPAYLGKLKSLK